ncbi:MAG: hypothetical protein NTV48_03285 [Candidatus Vogelbacteria bacterium]|nr:hypothetical protein [Candidatus Vogelbacteria bacterium]
MSSQEQSQSIEERIANLNTLEEVEDFYAESANGNDRISIAKKWAHLFLDELKKVETAEEAKELEERIHMGPGVKTKNGSTDRVIETITVMACELVDHKVYTLNFLREVNNASTVEEIDKILLSHGGGEGEGTALLSEEKLSLETETDKYEEDATRELREAFYRTPDGSIIFYPREVALKKREELLSQK